MPAIAGFFITKLIHGCL